MYSNGDSERILGKAMKEIGAPRSSFVILTKFLSTWLLKGYQKLLAMTRRLTDW
jgi:aryl-alcohol dehydrogenase-like predicted oxidoreductase